MNGEQLTKFVEDYGIPGAFFIVCFVVIVSTIVLLIKAYPVVAAVVDFVNLIRGHGEEKSLGDRLSTIEQGQGDLKDANGRKEETLQAIRIEQATQAKAISGLGETLSEQGTVLTRHMDWGDRENAEIHAAIDSIGDVQRQVTWMAEKIEAIDVKSEAVVHEVKHNGGSSMKDATKRQEDRLERVEGLLRQFIQGTAEAADR